MPKISLATIANLDNPNTAVAQLNSNFDIIEAEVDTLLSRDGSTPNTMLDNLDMNENRITNLPVPISDQEPARHGDIQQYVDRAEDAAVAAELAEAHAETAETNAETAAAAAEAALLDLRSRYIGSASENPTTDAQGNALVLGALYFNTTLNNFRVFAEDDVHNLGDPVVVGTDPVVIRYWLPFPQATLLTLNDVNADDIVDDDILMWNAGTDKFLPVALSAENCTFDDSGLTFSGSTVQAAIEDLADSVNLNRYDMVFFIGGLLSEDEVLYKLVAPRTFTIPSDTTGFIADATVAATAETVLGLYNEGVQFGTVTFAAAGDTGTFSIAGDSVFNAGDVFEIRGPASPDTSLKDLSIAILATR